MFYKIRAFTAGYVHELGVVRGGRLGVGADATVYHMPEDLLQFWQSSHSYHVFLRWRPQGRMPQMEM